jgi:hypothetical protein
MAKRILFLRVCLFGILSVRVWLRKDGCGFCIAFSFFFVFLGVLEREAPALVLFLWSGWCREVEMGNGREPERWRF